MMTPYVHAPTKLMFVYSLMSARAALAAYFDGMHQTFLVDLNDRHPQVPIWIFNLDSYDQDLELVEGVKLRDLNTQICEQTNSILQRIATSVSADPCTSRLSQYYMSSTCHQH